MRSRPEAETSVAAIMKIQEKPWRVRRPVSSSGDGEKQLDSRLTWEVELMRFPEEYLQDSILNGFFYFLLKSLFTNYLFTYQINFIKVWFPCDTMYTFKCTLLTSAHLCNHWHDQDLEHFHQVKIPLRSASLLPPAPGNHKSAFCHDRLVLLDFHAIGIMRFVLFCLWPHSLRIFWYPSMLCAWAVCNILLITGIHWVVDHSLFTRDGHFLCRSHSFFVSFLIFLKTLESRYYFSIFQMRKLNIRRNLSKVPHLSWYLKPVCLWLHVSFCPSASHATVATREWAMEHITFPSIHVLIFSFFAPDSHFSVLCTCHTIPFAHFCSLSQASVQIPVLLLPHCVTLGKPHHLSEHQSPCETEIIYVSSSTGSCPVLSPFSASLSFSLALF